MSLTYQFHNGSIWKWSEHLDGTPFCVWVDPEIAARLLPLHAADPCTKHLAEQLAEAMTQQQNDAMESVA